MYINISLIDVTPKKSVPWNEMFSNFTLYTTGEYTTCFIFEIFDCIDETIELIEKYLNEWYDWNEYKIHKSNFLLL